MTPLCRHRTSTNRMLQRYLAEAFEVTRAGFFMGTRLDPSYIFRNNIKTISVPMTRRLVVRSDEETK